MPTTLTQSDLDTLNTAVRDSNTGPYNEIGTDVGELAVGNLSTAFERNIASLIAMIEFTVANTADPAAAEKAAARQRKMLKEALIKMSAKIKTASSSTVDDRANVAAGVTTAVIRKWNSDNRPDASNTNTL